MSTTAPTSTTCPGWCVVDVDQHLTDLADPLDPATFHRSSDVDAWARDYHYSRNNVSVRVETYEMSDGTEAEELVIIDGDLGRGSQYLYELTVADAERLGLALLDAVGTARGSAGVKP